MRYGSQSHLLVRDFISSYMPVLSIEVFHQNILLEGVEIMYTFEHFIDHTTLYHQGRDLYSASTLRIYLGRCGLYHQVIFEKVQQPSQRIQKGEDYVL